MFYGGDTSRIMLVLYQSHAINKLNYASYYINHMWLIYNIQKIWLLISRFTKQFPSNDFYKHFICFKLLITLYFLLCISYFKLIYNCVSNKCSLYLNCFIKLMPSNCFIRLTSSRSFLEIIIMFQMSYKNLFMLLLLINCMPIYV